MIRRCSVSREDPDPPSHSLFVPFSLLTSDGNFKGTDASIVPLVPPNTSDLTQSTILLRISLIFTPRPLPLQSRDSAMYVIWSLVKAFQRNSFTPLSPMTFSGVQ